MDHCKMLKFKKMEKKVEENLMNLHENAKQTNGFDKAIR